VPAGPARAHVTEQIPVQRERERRQDQQRQREREYDDYEDEYYDQYARPVSPRPEAQLYGRPKSDEYSRRSRLDRYEPDEEGAYEPRRSAELKQIFQTGEIHMPTSGPPRHRLVEENSDSYVPTSATTPSPKYVGSARPRHIEQAELEPDETPTLVDMAARRARRGPSGRADNPGTSELPIYSEPTDIRAAAGSRRGRRRRPPEETIDERYWVS
jgi:hypothetical protein